MPQSSNPRFVMAMKLFYLVEFGFGFPQQLHGQISAGLDALTEVLHGQSVTFGVLEDFFGNAQ